MRRDYIGMAPLIDSGKLITDPKEKAIVLKKQFESVFVKERSIQPTLLKESTFPDMDDIVISTQG